MQNLPNGPYPQYATRNNSILQQNMPQKNLAPQGGNYPQYQNDDWLQKIKEWISQIGGEFSSAGQWWNKNTPVQYSAPPSQVKSLEVPSENLARMFSGENGVKLVQMIASLYKQLGGK